MAKANAAAEPSMEEILASIRRIISDDAPAGSKAAPARPSAVEAPRPAPVAPASEDDLDRLFASSPDEADDILDLIETEASPAPEPVGLAPEKPDVEFMEADVPTAEPVETLSARPALKAAPPPAAQAQPQPQPSVQPQTASRRVADDTDESLVSPDTSSTVNAAFGHLTHTILSANAKTLDDIVKELLRPMLKSWLDDNLPVIVERLVRAEIERVARGR